MSLARRCRINLAGTLQSHLRTEIGAAVRETRTRTGWYCYSRIDLPVTPDRYRVADVAIFDGPAEEPYPKRPALAVVEIVSPQDPHPELLDRLHDYHVWGVPYIWLIDPEHRTIHRYDGASLLAVDAIELQRPAFRLTGAELFAELA